MNRTKVSKGRSKVQQGGFLHSPLFPPSIKVSGEGDWTPCGLLLAKSQ